MNQLVGRTNTRFGGPLGVVRNRTHELLRKKAFIRNMKNRTDDVQSNTALATTRDIYKLPPRWIDFYEELRDKINEIRQISDEIKKLGDDRIRASTRTADNILEQRMQQQIDAAMQMIKDCEKNLQRIAQDQQFDETEDDKLIRTNISLSVAQQIADVTCELRSHQKRLFDSMNVAPSAASMARGVSLNPRQRPFGNSNGIFDDQQQQQQQQVDGFGQTQQLQIQRHDLNQSQMVENIEIELIEHMARERNERIDKIVTQIKQLSELFRDMNRVIIEQGTLLDRIDFNLQKIVKKTNIGKKQLQKLNERHEKSDRVQKCMCCLLTSIIIMTMILVLKNTVLS